MRIVYFSPDYAIRNRRPLFGGAPHYRCILPARELAKHGHETYVSPTIIVHQETGFLTGQTSTSEIPDPDIMVIHSWPENGVDAILRARQAGQIVIGDCDDLMWELPEGHQAESLNSEEKNLEHIKNNLLACTAITVSTPYIKQWMDDHWGAEPFLKRIHVVRNAVDLEAFEYNSMRSKVRTVGWSGNPLWRADDLSILRPWLGRFLEKNDLVFIHVGALPIGSIADQLDIPKDRLLQRPFRTFEDYRPANPLREIDIQFIPLMDCGFNRAKSALKGLESAAWGIPFNGTALDEYTNVFGMSGQMSQSNCEFLLSRKNRETIRDHQYSHLMEHSITDRWRNWESIYRELAAS